ncbi:hypothetical protein BD779DRAFT_974736 [Infundibulicybe gibba]|nr:hypothetical protein BD779DRAFT_974736 [Infundibulicybe gibba]
MSSSRDDRYYTGLGKPRRSPPAGDPQSGVFFQTGQGGRTVLPPLSSAFPTSRFPVPTGYSNQYMQPRSSSGRYEYNQLYNQWTSNTNSPQVPNSFTNYDNHERFSPQPAYSTYPSRTSPPIPGNAPDSRKLPPLATSNAGVERWPQSSFIPSGPTYPSAGIRSPTASYPTAYTAYPTSNQASGYSYHIGPPEPHGHHVPSMATQGHVSGYEGMDSSRPEHRSSSPYSRSSSHVSPPGYTPPPISPTSEEPAIKKKRKRADAAQLKVLNETYSRTAFPSTEERHALAKALDMSARSVQIWFQNKRQSMRQTNRQSSTVSSNSQQSFAMSSTQDPILDDMGHTSGGGYGPGPIPMTENSYMPRSQETPRPQQPSSSHRRIRSQEDVADPRKWRGY